MCLARSSIWVARRAQHGGTAGSSWQCPELGSPPDPLGVPWVPAGSELAVPVLRAGFLALQGLTLSRGCLELQGRLGWAAPARHRGRGGSSCCVPAGSTDRVPPVLPRAPRAEANPSHCLSLSCSGLIYCYWHPATSAICIRCQASIYSILSASAHTSLYLHLPH